MIRFVVLFPKKKPWDNFQTSWSFGRSRDLLWTQQGGDSQSLGEGPGIPGGPAVLSTQGFPFQLFPASGGFLEKLHWGAVFFSVTGSRLSGCNKGQGGVLLINIQMAIFVAKVSTMSWGHFFWWSDCYPFVGPCGVRLFLSEDEGHLAWMDQSIEPRYSWVGNDKCGMYNIL